MESAAVTDGQLYIWARAIGGQRPVIQLVVRRFFCGNPDCPNKTFAEQIQGLTSRSARRTPPLAQMLTAIALALAGRAGARHGDGARRG